MIPLELAASIVRLVAGYLLIGTGFSVPFTVWWAGRLDPVAAHGTRGFRLLILPGAALLWPLLVLRLLRGDTSPPMERTAHRGRPR